MGRSGADGGWGDWFPLGRLVWVGAAGAAWFVRPDLGGWIVLTAAMPWLFHALRTGQVWHRTPFDVPLLLFLATAAASLAVAYDPQGARAVFPGPIGWGKLWGLVLAVLVFDAAAALETGGQRRGAVRLLAGFGAAVALWFLLTNDWDAVAGAPALIARLGRLIQAPLPALPGHRLNPNVAAGIMGLTLPMALTLGAAPRRWDRGYRPWTVLGLLAAAVMALGITLSVSRGAWLAAAAVLCLAAAWAVAGVLARRRVVAFLALIVVGAVVGAAALLTVPTLRALALKSDAVANRAALFSQGLLLVRDYPFTGFGLGQYAFVHSTYALLIHVPVLVFAHSTPLDVALEQGLPAALILLAVWGGAAWMGLRALSAGRSPTGLAAGLLSLAVLAVHGAFDNAIYGSRALPLLWLPVGLLVAAYQHRPAQPLPADHADAIAPDPVAPGRDIAGAEADGGSEAAGGAAGPGGQPPVRSGRRYRRWGVAAGAGAALVLAVGLLFWRPLGAAWHANLGAVHQTVVELRAYDWHRFDDPTLAEVREMADLSTAEGHFQRALALDPGQPTARTRLSQIAHARGAYDEALHHAQAAWDAGHRDRVTRLVLGDALVAHGRVDDAVAMVDGLERAAMRLDVQVYHHFQRQGDHERATWARQAAQAVGP